MNEKITFICVEKHANDNYYEDEEGREQNTLDGKTTIETYIIPTDEANVFYKNYLERNADNPPYDSYYIKLAFRTNSKEVIPLRWFEVEND